MEMGMLRVWFWRGTWITFFSLFFFFVVGGVINEPGLFSWRL